MKRHVHRGFCRRPQSAAPAKRIGGGAFVSTLAALIIMSGAGSSATISAGATAQLPAEIVRQLPPGYRVLADVGLDAGTDNGFRIVALGRRDEAAAGATTSEAPARPLLIFARRAGRYLLAGRNDEIILHADEGGQCDPFLDGDATIATKGRYFTIENGVACGQHWTDYITFRFDPHAARFVFDNERRESWSLNRDTRPDAEALVRDDPPHVIRDRPGHQTAFSDWHRLP